MGGVAGPVLVRAQAVQVIVQPASAAALEGVADTGGGAGATHVAHRASPAHPVPRLRLIQGPLPLIQAVGVQPLCTPRAPQHLGETYTRLITLKDQILFSQFHVYISQLLITKQQCYTNNTKHTPTFIKVDKKKFNNTKLN